jgi:hypothetical protein
LAFPFATLSSLRPTALTGSSGFAVLRNTNAASPERGLEQGRLEQCPSQRALAVRRERGLC